MSTDARGTDRFVFARATGDGALAEVPDGYEVSETLNGVVSLGKVKPRIIREDEERLVAQAVHGVHRHAVEVKKNVIYVMEGAAPTEMFGRVHIPSGQFSPVLRFTLIDVDERQFEVCRMRYTGMGGWSHPLGIGTLRDVVRQTVPHLRAVLMRDRRAAREGPSGWSRGCRTTPPTTLTPTTARSPRASARDRQRVRRRLRPMRQHRPRASRRAGGCAGIGAGAGTGADAQVREGRSSCNRSRPSRADRDRLPRARCSPREQVQQGRRAGARSGGSICTAVRSVMVIQRGAVQLGVPEAGRARPVHVLAGVSVVSGMVKNNTGNHPDTDLLGEPGPGVGSRPPAGTGRCPSGRGWWRRMDRNRRIVSAGIGPS